MSAPEFPASREWYTRGWVTHNEPFTTVSRSCLHCQRQPSKHTNGQCLFSNTYYQRFGNRRASALLVRQDKERQNLEAGKPPTLYHQALDRYMQEAAAFHGTRYGR